VPDLATTDDRPATTSVCGDEQTNTEGARETALDRLVGVALAGFAASVIAAFWVPALFHGLMTDELLSAWVSSDGLGEAVDRAFIHQGNSPLYFVALWTWRAVAGSSELMLRLPSVLCLVLAAWQMARLGMELDGGRRLTGLIAAFVLLAHTDVMLAGITARPYALLLLSVVVSVRALIHFLHSARWSAGLVCTMAAATALLMSPFAILALFGHLVALLDAARGHGISPAGQPTPRVDPRTWQRRLPPLALLGVLASLPVVPQVLALARRSDELVLVSVPGIADLFDALVPLPLAAAVAVGILAGGWRGRRTAPDPALRLVAAWAFGPVASCWVVSNLTGTSIWVDRYRLAAVPAFALLAGLGVGRIRCTRGRAVACATLVVLMIWLAAASAGLHRHGWREAVDWARTQTAGESVTIAIDTDLIELQNLDLLRDPAWQEYLSGPIEHYGLPGEVVLLPKGPAEEARAFQKAMIDELASGRSTVVVVSRVLFRSPPDQVGAFRAAMVTRGWTETAGPIVGPHQAVVFRRPK
jgi:mannosyltransferase